MIPIKDKYQKFIFSSGENQNKTENIIYGQSILKSVNTNFQNEINFRFKHS